MRGTRHTDHQVVSLQAASRPGAFCARAREPCRGTSLCWNYPSVIMFFHSTVWSPHLLQIPQKWQGDNYSDLCLLEVDRGELIAVPWTVLIFHLLMCCRPLTCCQNLRLPYEIIPAKKFSLYASSCPSAGDRGMMQLAKKRKTKTPGQ